MSHKLFLAIKSEPYIIKCNDCDIRHEESQMGAILGMPRPDNYSPSEAFEDCSCNGTMEQTVRLETKPDKLIEVAFAHMIEFPKKPTYRIEGFNGTHLLSNLDHRLTKAYKAGTLPDHIRDCLHEVPI